MHGICTYESKDLKPLEIHGFFIPSTFQDEEYGPIAAFELITITDNYNLSQSQINTWALATYVCMYIIFR